MSTEEKKHITPEELAVLEQTHGDVALLRDKDDRWEVVVRKPKRAEYKQFRSQAKHDKDEAQEILFRKCVVYPDSKTFDGMLEQWPGICDGPGASEALKRLMGMSAEEDAKS